MAAEIKAIVGLGNPGPEYAKTRHNAGFWFLDRMAVKAGATFRAERKMRGDVATVAFGTRQVRLLKPNTFVNRSGEAVNALKSFYKLSPESLLIVYDELDLAPGDVRFKSEGGHGGHNGLRDIISRVGTRQFPRIRIGIGHPGHKDAVVSFVLGRPSQEDRERIEQSIETVVDVISLYVDGEWEKATHELHTQMRTRRREPE